jgi:hypothetical protein
MYTGKKINCVATHKVCSFCRLYKSKGLCVCVCARACVPSAVTDFTLQGTKSRVFCPHKCIMKIIYRYF